MDSSPGMLLPEFVSPTGTRSPPRLARSGAIITDSPVILFSRISDIPSHLEIDYFSNISLPGAMIFSTVGPLLSGTNYVAAMDEPNQSRLAQAPTQILEIHRSDHFLRITSDHFDQPWTQAFAFRCASTYCSETVTTMDLELEKSLP